jgi:hypothetical protein
VAPQWAEAWHIAGENFARFGSLAGYADAQARGDAAYRRAFALDTAHLQNLRSLLASALRSRNREDVRRYSAFYFSQIPNDDLDDFLRWSTALVLGDSASVASVRSRLQELAFVILQTIVMWSQANGIGLGDGARAAELLLRRAGGGGERRLAAQTTVPLLLNTGRPEDANRVLAGFEQGFGRNQAVGGVREFQIYAALYWDGDSSAATGAAKRLESFLGGASMGPGEVGDSQTASCALAHWYVAKENVDAAREMLTRMRQLARRPSVMPGVVSPACATVVEAQLEARSNRSSRTDALARLDSMCVATSNYRDQLVPVGNIVAARLYERRGDARRALAIVRRRTAFNFYLATQLRQEGRLAASIGDRAGAIRAYRHYLALRSDAEPRLKPDVERVRRELDQLEK